MAIYFDELSPISSNAVEFRISGIPAGKSIIHVRKAQLLRNSRGACGTGGLHLSSVDEACRKDGGRQY